MFLILGHKGKVNLLSIRAVADLIIAGMIKSERWKTKSLST